MFYICVTLYRTAEDSFNIILPHIMFFVFYITNFYCVFWGKNISLFQQSRRHLAVDIDQGQHVLGLATDQGFHRLTIDEKRQAQHVGP